MSRLNLVALTEGELSALLGAGRAQQLLPDLSTARLAGRAYPGPELPQALGFEPLAGGSVGSTAEQARTLDSVNAQLLAQGLAALGAYRVSGVLRAPLRLTYASSDTAAMLCWDESGAAASGTAPFVSLLSVLRDQASGVATVMTETAPNLIAPSEESDAVALPGAAPEVAWSQHHARLSRHGRAAKIGGWADFVRAWELQFRLNHSAWARRGLMIESA